MNLKVVVQNVDTRYDFPHASGSCTYRFKHDLADSARGCGWTIGRHYAEFVARRISGVDGEAKTSNDDNQRQTLHSKNC